MALLCCHALRDCPPAAGELRVFEASVALALTTWPTARLRVCCLSCNPRLLAGGPLLAPRPRMMGHAYVRVQSVEENRDTKPPFFCALVVPAAADAGDRKAR